MWSLENKPPKPNGYHVLMLDWWCVDVSAHSCVTENSKSAMEAGIAVWALQLNLKYESQDQSLEGSHERPLRLKSWLFITLVANLTSHRLFHDDARMTNRATGQSASSIHLIN